MVITLQRITPSGEFEHGIFAQMIAVIGVFITTGHLQNSLHKEVWQRMINIGLMTLVVNSAGQLFNQAAVKDGFTQQQSTKIRG